MIEKSSANNEKVATLWPQINWSNQDIYKFEFFRLPSQKKSTYLPFR